MESRKSYGWSIASGVNSKETIAKHQVGYRTDDGGYGEIGWRLFDTYEAAAEFGQQFKEEKSYVTEIIIKHPSKCYSNY